VPIDKGQILVNMSICSKTSLATTYLAEVFVPRVFAGWSPSRGNSITFVCDQQPGPFANVDTTKLVLDVNHLNRHA
jgi:hypothetical protein